MNTSPKNQSALFHNAKLIAPEPQAGELLWLCKGIDVEIAELRTHEGGVELQFSHNGEWYYGRRHNVRAFALDEAAAARRDLEQDGWVEHS
jgi:hypothetical protein